MQVGMWTFASVGMYQQKGLKALQVSLQLPPSAQLRKSSAQQDNKALHAS